MKKKVLLMGKSGSGKTSMRSIIFANYIARDTRRLKPDCLTFYLLILETINSLVTQWKFLLGTQQNGIIIIIIDFIQVGSHHRRRTLSRSTLRQPDPESVGLRRSGGLHGKLLCISERKHFQKCRGKSTLLWRKWIQIISLRNICSMLLRCSGCLNFSF